MSYHISKTVDMGFEQAVASTTQALQRHGFGVLTQIDVEKTLNNKLGVEFRPYLIIGACNPRLAYQALRAENKIGTMLPCNIVVQRRDDDRIEVSAVDPVASMQSVTNVELGHIAQEVRSALQSVVEEVGERSARP